MITCSKCKEAKEESEFNKHGSKRQSFCRPCDNQKAREYYALNRDRQVKQINAARKLRRKATNDWIRELKESTPCADCGNLFPWYVMDFDHLHSKVDDVSEMAAKVRPRDAIKEEIAKCEVVCANCHRIRTFTRV
jgi:hypothetical protein